jgi:2-dehydro-3-deoxyglucarate aldolase
MQLPDASIAEIMGRAGYDWIAIDLEHGLFAVESLPDICRALELGGAVPFVRIAQNACKDIKQAVEAGARGIIVPMIESRRAIDQAISWTKYPPIGCRGVGYSRANLFGKHFDEHFRRFNEEVVIVAQIEHINAMAELDAILEADGLDAIMVGPYDLSASMGLTGQFENPEFVRNLEVIRKKALLHEIPMGLHIVKPDPELLRCKIAEKYQFIAYGIDAVFLNNAAPNPLKTSVSK